MSMKTPPLKTLALLAVACLHCAFACRAYRDYYDPALGSVESYDMLKRISNKTLTMYYSHTGGKSKKYSCSYFKLDIDNLKWGSSYVYKKQRKYLSGTFEVVKEHRVAYLKITPSESTSSTPYYLRNTKKWYILYSSSEDFYFSMCYGLFQVRRSYFFSSNENIPKVGEKCVKSMFSKLFGQSTMLKATKDCKFHTIDLVKNKHIEGVVAEPAQYYPS